MRGWYPGALLILSLALNALLIYSNYHLDLSVAEYRGLVYRCLKMYDKGPRELTQRDNLPRRGSFQGEP